MTNSNPNLPFALVILDGLAINPDPRANAVASANKPCLDNLLENFPHTTLCSFGHRVGLPDGQMGNSEVGHLNIGAGRVVDQLLTRIDRSISEGTLKTNPELKHFCSKAASGDKALHLVGLMSSGGVHSQAEHFRALLWSAAELGVCRIFVHAITDGRDCSPNAALSELEEINSFIAETQDKFPNATIRLATIVGRYYAMDRDTRWERTQRAYELFTSGKGEKFDSTTEALTHWYNKNITDEFIEPTVINGPNLTYSPYIEDGDSVLFYNFRADRMRQIVSAFFQPEDKFPYFPRQIPNKKSIETLNLACLAEYDAEFPLTVLFPPIPIRKHLGEVLSQHGLTQLRAAETEKYPHVTYFFNGGEEQPYAGEDRLLVPSRRDIATYDLAPEMSAVELTDRLVEDLRSKKHDVLIVNYANCDMVGHTGDFEATVKAVQTVDACLSRFLSELFAQGGTALVTADHGNADQMLDYQTGEKHTFHTLHPVPLILASSNNSSAKIRALRLQDGGALCDIAPTILNLLEIEQPQEMTGRSLVKPPLS